MPPRLKLKFPRFEFLGLICGAVVLGAAAQACNPDMIDIRTGNAKVRFAISVADDDKERAQGLMFVEQMDQFTGMLFVYEAPLRAQFWMKNTLIPLDMIFADETGTVVRIHENATPLSERTIDGGPDVLAVLEINGGLSRKLGLREGSEMRHPAFDQAKAAWGCDQ